MSEYAEDNEQDIDVLQQDEEALVKRFDQDEEKTAKKRGNPAWVKGQGSMNPQGRPKGSRNASTLAREALAKCGYDPIQEIVKHYKKLDKPAERVKLALALMEYTYTKPEKTTNVNVNEKSVQIVWTYGETKDSNELDALRAELGLKQLETKPANIIDGDIVTDIEDQTTVEAS